MSALVRCRACGYVMREVKVRDVCPACGFKKSVFQPHEEKISPRRRFLLDLDAHPILVHFPQCFASILPPLVAVHLLLPDFYGPELAAVIGFVSLVLPLSVVGAIASGLFDASLKLKRLDTPALVCKIAAGVALLLLSAANTLLILLWGLAPAKLFILGLSLGCLVCAILLGMMGKKLIAAILP
ncbi:MAG: hypothetical protein JW809_10690 [Pirellulales bacterium]|nr:hypothetical protein [Pirellulales bacterium]